MRNGIKRIVIAFVMICMAGVVMPEMTAKAAVEGNYEYEEREDGSVWITHYTGKETKVVIPSQLGGKNVTGIEDQAFVVWVEGMHGFVEDASTVTEVVFPDTLTYIGNWNFYQLTSIHIPKNVTYIGSRAFGTEHVESITVDSANTVYRSENNAIITEWVDEETGENIVELVRACNKTVIPDGVTHIGSDSFFDYSLPGIDIPDSVTDIGYCAFAGCAGLTSITIPESVTTINEDAFFGCSNMTAYVEPGSYAEKWAQEKKYTLEVEIPGERCKVRTLSHDASNPTVAYVGTTDESAKSIEVPDAVTIEDVVYKVVSIADNAFSGNENVTKVVSGKNVASIGEKAFSDCPSLEEVVLSASLESVSPDVFEGTVEAEDETKLKVTIPEETEDVSKAGIENITNIQYVVIYVPEGSKTEIYLKQFDYLVIITYPPIQTPAENKDNEQKVETPKTTEQVTEAPKPQVEQPEKGKKYTVNNLTYKVTSSKTVIFMGTSKKSNKTLTIPAKVTILGQSLEVTAIEKRAMKKCSKLTTVVIGSNVKTVGDEAFMNCSHLKKVTIGKNVKTIGKKAFSGDKKLTKIIFKGAKVSKIEKKALYKVPKKVAIKAPKKVTKKYAKLLNGTRK